ncbi:MAG: flagellar biosynthetic protein FliR [Gammaproteobacteria bacterium]|nr:MAG: flagellar biosynthetic protein FliR [Gammaproteobacteria bacterium]
MQELVVNEAQINQFIGQYLWPLMRISAFYFAVPVIGARTVPARIRIMLSLFTALLVVPLLPNAPTVSFMSVEGMLMMTKEIIIGLALGFALQIVMHVFVLAGQLIALKLGLGFAAQNDPSSGVSVTVLSQFYLLLATLLFLAINGHLAVINMLVNSFTTFPVGGPGLSNDDYVLIVHMFSWMFAAGLLISLPLFTSMMIVNISFGVMGRSAPQLNILNVGFPITLMFGFILMWYSLSNFLPLFNQIIEEGLSVANTLVGSP